MGGVPAPAVPAPAAPPADVVPSAFGQAPPAPAPGMCLSPRAAQHPVDGLRRAQWADSPRPVAAPVAVSGFGQVVGGAPVPAPAPAQPTLDLLSGFGSPAPAPSPPTQQQCGALPLAIACAQWVISDGGGLSAGR